MTVERSISIGPTVGIAFGVVGVLFALLAIGIEIGFRVGLKIRGRFSQAARNQINSMRASMLGMLALLLGFTFSQSLQRFDARSEALIDEANAIGTAYLRAELTPPSVCEPMNSLTPPADARRKSRGMYQRLCCSLLDIPRLSRESRGNPFFLTQLVWQIQKKDGPESPDVQPADLDLAAALVRRTTV